jgi:hypothetical protein
MVTASRPSTLAFYTAPARMTAAGRYAPRFDGLPGDVAGLAGVAQGVLVHEFLAEFYGVTLTEEDRGTVHLRRVEELLERIVARDDRPLDVAREPQGRIAANCRHFSVLTVAMLRARGVPARARCGFGAYFVAGRFEDHWVVEYWHRDEQRWVLVDAQIDRAQGAVFPIDFDVLDVPRDRFVIGADAWLAYRAGDADPDLYGLTMIDEAGAWWIAANLMRDAAALTNLELLPWDVWGSMPEPEDVIDDELAACFDRLAVLTQAPDETFDELMDVMDRDDRVRVPPTVRNVTRGRDEAI